MDGSKRYVRMVLNIVIPILEIALFLWLVPRLLGYFMPFVLAWLIAVLANPLVKLFERRLCLVRRHGSMLILCTVLVLVLGTCYLVGSVLYRELSGFMKDAPLLFEGMRLEVNQALQNGERLLIYLPAGIRDSILAAAGNLNGILGEVFSQAAAPTVEIAGQVARSLPNILVNTVVFLVASYLFLADYDRILDWLKAHLPSVVKQYLLYMKQDARGLIGGYFLAQFRIMFVVFLILFFGFLILRVKYSLLWAAVIALLDFLPVFGTGTILFPWALIKLFAGEYVYAAALVLIYLTTQLIRQLIQPKIVGDSMGLPPLMTLFLLYLGFKLRGIAGMILAVPLGMLVINFYKYGMFHSMLQNLKQLIHEIQKFRRGNA